MRNTAEDVLCHPVHIPSTETPSFHFIRLDFLISIIKQSCSQVLKWGAAGRRDQFFIHLKREHQSVAAQFILIRCYFAFHPEKRGIEFHLKK